VQAQAITDAIILSDAVYVGSADAAASAYALNFQSLISTPAGAFVVGAAGIVLGVAGVKYFIEGLKEGDIGKVVIGGAAAYGGYLLLAAVVSCFTGDTVIELADGTSKPISEIKIGDLVLNHDRTKVNKVLMIQISDSKGFGNALWSPSKDIEPFATLNHPIYIDGVLSSPMPDMVTMWQPWVGSVEKAEGATVSRVLTQKVYNIYPDGDATFRVYNYGAPSLADGDTTTFRMYEQGVITFDDAQDILNGIIHESAEYGPNAIYGGVILDRIMRKIGSNLLMKAAIKLWLLKNPKLRSIMFKFITLVGATGQRIKNKKDKK
jgi:hypothetical protein